MSTYVVLIQPYEREGASPYNIFIDGVNDLDACQEVIRHLEITDDEDEFVCPETLDGCFQILSDIDISGFPYTLSIHNCQTREEVWKW